MEEFPFLINDLAFLIEFTTELFWYIPKSTREAESPRSRDLVSSQKGPNSPFSIPILPM